MYYTQSADILATMFDDVTFSMGDDQIPNATPEGMKFGLFIKAREVSQLAEVLQALSTKPKTQRLQWLRENEAVVAELVNTFTDESISTLEGATLDREMMGMSMEMMSNLRRVLLMLDGLFYDKRLAG